MAKKSHSEFAPKYKIGDKVRVIHGFMDVDYPDMPLGGWAGTVKDVQGSDTFTVRWSKETLKAIHPVFLKRCEIDGTGGTIRDGHIEIQGDHRDRIVVELEGMGYRVKRAGG